MPQKVTVFSLTKCPHCIASKELLKELGVEYVEINVQKESWRKAQLPLLLGAGAAITMPQIFIGSESVGGNSELKALHESGELAAKLQAIKEAPDAEFPPPFPKPTKQALLAEVPQAFRAKWTNSLGALDKALGGGISSLLIMLEGPDTMIVLCTAGEKSATDIYKPDEEGPKGDASGEEQLYCQVALEKGETLFIDDPTKFPGLEKNEDYTKFGYGYYIGSPWRQRGGTLSGTIAVMEKVPGKFKPEHVAVVELFRDLFEQHISLPTVDEAVAEAVAVAPESEARKASVALALEEMQAELGQFETPVVDWEVNTSGGWLLAPFKLPKDVQPGKKCHFTFVGTKCELEFTSHTEGNVTCKGKVYLTRCKTQ